MSHKTRTQSLFIETNKAPHMEPMFTLKDEDHETGLPSLYLLYLDSNDPLERNFAKEHIPGGWTNWQRLCAAPFFKDYIQRWRDELDVAIRSKALLNIRTLAETSQLDTTKYQASKFLLEGKWNPHLLTDEKVEGKRGRPSSKKNQRQVLSHAQEIEKQLIDEHFKNLN